MNSDYTFNEEHFSFTAFNKQTEPVALPMLNGMVPTLRKGSKGGRNRQVAKVAGTEKWK